MRETRKKRSGPKLTESVREHDALLHTLILLLAKRASRLSDREYQASGGRASERLHDLANKDRGEPRE
jgi:hypothetical protein